MAGERGAFKVIQGDRPDNDPVQRIALSLVHPRGCVHIPVSAILWIEAHAEIVFADERGRPFSFPSPHVEICVTPPVREQIHRLTKEIVDQTMAIFVAGQCVVSPVVREPICTSDASFNVSAYDFDDAQTLAQRLRTGWREAGPRLVD